MNQSKKKRKQAKKDKSTSKKDKSTSKKDKSTSRKKCTHFCKNDYAAELYKQNPSDYETKTRQRSIDNQLCRRSFCDEDCKGPAYKFHDNTLFQTLFRNRLKNGFLDTFTKKEVEMLKKRGALSGCINLMKTNTPLQPNNKYDIFHK
jgi:hypothetical protein